MSVKKLIALVLVFALAMTTSSVVAAATCKHVDATAHLLALSDKSSVTAAAAQLEDTVADELKKKRNLADSGSVQLAGYLLPADSGFLLAAPSGFTHRAVTGSARLKSRSVIPLLKPPAQ